MTTPHGRRALCWIAMVSGFAAGTLLAADPATGQDEVIAAPRAFPIIRGSDGSHYAGLDYNPRRSGSAQRRFGSAMPIHGEIVEEGEIIYEGQPRFIAEADEVLPPPTEGEIVFESGPLPPGGIPHEIPHGGVLHGGPCESCGVDDCLGCGTGLDCASCGMWDSCGRDDCNQCISLCLPRFRHLTLFGGVHGFKGPRDNGVNSNFGFHEGINVSGRAPFWGRCGVGYQLGYRAAQSRLHGDATSSDGRAQHFFTAALFRRSAVGLQYGLAYDLLNDDLDADLDFSQLRPEISMRGPRGGEFGFLGMFHLNNQSLVQGNATVELEPVDQYLLFFRTRFENCGEGRLWAGFTDDSDGIFGGEFLVPLDNRWSIGGGFNYLIPESDAPPQGAIQEAWNVGISVVWHWNCDAKSSYNSPFRPLFNVADNGTMIINRP